MHQCSKNVKLGKIVESGGDATCIVLKERIAAIVIYITIFALLVRKGLKTLLCLYMWRYLLFCDRSIPTLSWLPHCISISVYKTGN